MTNGNERFFIFKDFDERFDEFFYFVRSQNPNTNRIINTIRYDDIESLVQAINRSEYPPKNLYVAQESFNDVYRLSQWNDMTEKEYIYSMVEAYQKSFNDSKFGPFDYSEQPKFSRHQVKNRTHLNEP